MFLAQAAPPLTAELKELYASFQRCLDLRDKYMSASLQTLGDDPRDHDGVFIKPPPVDSSIRPSDPGATPKPATNDSPQFEPWKIYPPPPPPHWKFKAHNARTPEVTHAHEDGDVPFEFSKCEMPDAGPWEWEMDEKGVFQVYQDASGASLFAKQTVLVLRCERRLSTGPQAAFQCPYDQGFLRRS